MGSLEPPRPRWGWGRGDKGVLLSGTRVLAISGQKKLNRNFVKRGANDGFHDPPQRGDSKAAIFIVFFLVLNQPQTTRMTAQHRVSAEMKLIGDG